MKCVDFPDIQQWPMLSERPYTNNVEIRIKTSEILNEIKNNNNEALIKYSQLLDGIKLQNFKASVADSLAFSSISKELKNAIQQAYKNIERFHLADVPSSFSIETLPGLVCTKKYLPIERVGIYIPGGTAPLFSTLLMLGIPAKIAGCKEIMVCTPPQSNGKIHPAIAFTAQLLGIEEIYTLGGIPAIGAMAYGTPTIKKVDKIFGPGNAWVNAAKLAVQAEGIAIDMPSGPSEVLIIANNDAPAQWVAADLLAQSEHGKDSQSILITYSQEKRSEILREMEVLKNKNPRKEILEAALKNGVALVLNNLSEALDFSNLYAPEHLMILDPDIYASLDKIHHAGSVFIGPYSPESAGDYASGTNHCLPTMGTARAYSGLSVSAFMKSVTFQEANKNAMQLLAPIISTMALEEGLYAHALSAQLRKDKDE